MDNKVQINSDQKRLKIAIIILAVLMILSAVGLAVRYIYLYVFTPTQTTVTVPDNLIGEDMEFRAQDTISTAEAQDFYVFVDGGTSAAPAGALSINGGVAGSLSSSRAVAAKLELYQGRPDVNQKFAVSNMLPGDYVTKYYCVRVSHDAGVDLFFRTEVTEETKIWEMCYISGSRVWEQTRSCVTRRFRRLTGRNSRNGLLKTRAVKPLFITA